MRAGGPTRIGSIRRASPPRQHFPARPDRTGGRSRSWWRQLACAVFDETFVFLVPRRSAFRLRQASAAVLLALVGGLAVLRTSEHGVSIDRRCRHGWPIPDARQPRPGGGCPPPTAAGRSSTRRISAAPPPDRRIRRQQPRQRLYRALLVQADNRNCSRNISFSCRLAEPHASRPRVADRLDHGESALIDAALRQPDVDQRADHRLGQPARLELRAPVPPAAAPRSPRADRSSISALQRPVASGPKPTSACSQGEP